MGGMDIFKQALSTTAVGMGTVFAVLLLMSLLISLFGFLPENRAYKKGAAKSENAECEIKELSSEEYEDDGELVAAITAAVYEALRSESKDPQEYSVKRIVKREDDYTARKIKR